MCVCQEEKDQQWKRAMDYLSAVSELNYMTQIVIMLYEDNNKVVFVLVCVLLLCTAFLTLNQLSSLLLKYEFVKEGTSSVMCKLNCYIASEVPETCHQELAQSILFR